MGNGGMSLTIVGLERVLKKLGPDLASKPLKRFFEQASHAIQAEAQRRAPVDTGHMRSKITKELDDGRPPLWAKVGTNVEHEGVSYPRILEESPIHHYAAGPFAGQPTRGWLSGALKTMRGRVQELVAELGDDIRATWEKR